MSLIGGGNFGNNDVDDDMLFQTLFLGNSLTIDDDASPDDFEWKVETGTLKLKKGIEEIASFGTGSVLIPDLQIGTTNVFDTTIIGTDSNTQVLIGNNEIKLKDVGVAHFSIVNDTNRLSIKDTSESGNLGAAGEELLTIHRDKLIGFLNNSPEQILHIGNNSLEENVYIQLQTTENMKSGLWMRGGNIDNYYITHEDLITGGKLSLGYNDGVDNDKMTIRENGYMGIGTTEPTKELDIIGTVRISNTEAATTELLIEGVGTNAEVFIQTDLGGSLKIKAQDNQNRITTNVDFRIDLDDVETNALTIQHSSGNIGIGIINPSATLDVNGTVNIDNHLTIQEQLYFKSSATRIKEWNGDMVLYTNNIERLKIDNINGYIGVGKSSPNYSIDVSGDVNVSGDYYKDGSLVNIINNWTDTGGNIYIEDGNVGIGTDTPTEPLHIVSSESIARMALFDSTSVATTASYIEVVNNANTRAIFGADGTGLAGGSTSDVIVGNFSSGALKFYTNGVERMRFTNDGNVGIGIENPTSTFQIRADETGNNDFVRMYNSSADVSGNTRIAIGYNNDAGASPGMGDNSAMLTYKHQGDLNIDNSINLGFGVQTDILQVRKDLTNQTTGRVNIKGLLGVNTTTPSCDLDVNGDGLISGDFTVDTNTLFVDSSSNEVGIGTITPSKKLDVNGTFNVSGSNGFSGNIISIIGEINSTNVAINTYYSYGAGSNSSHGPTMPVSGKVISLTTSSSSNSWYEVELYKNNTATGTIITQGASGAPPTTVKYATSNGLSVSFSAGDRLRMRTSLYGTGPDYPIATIFIKFD